MNLVLLLGRFALIVAGYAVATLAASAFLSVVMLAAFGLAAEDTRDLAMQSLVFSIPFVALFLSYLAFLPAALAILAGELLGKRDWLFYALAGAVVAAVVVGFVSGPEAGSETASDPGVMLAAIASGMVGGIAYWLVAGRSARGWRSPAGPAVGHDPGA